MSALKYENRFKIAFIVFTLALILFAEPVLAKESKAQGGKSSRGSQGSQKVQKASSAPKVQQQSNVRKATSSITAPSRATRSQTKVSAPKSSSRSSSIRLSQPGKVTQSSPSVSTTNIRKSFSNSISNKQQAVNSTTAQVPNVNPGNQLSSSKTSRIGGSINQPNPSTTSTQKVTATNKVNSVSSGRTSRIVSSVEQKTASSPNNLRQPASSASKRINSGKTEQIGGSINNRESSAATVSKEPSVNSSTRINQSKTTRIASAITKGKTLVANVKRRLAKPSISGKVGSDRTDKPSVSTPGKKSNGSRDGSIRSGDTGSAVDNKPAFNDTGKHSRDSKQQVGPVNGAKNNDRDIIGKSGESDKAHTDKITAGQRLKEAGRRALDRLLPSSRLRKAVRQDKEAFSGNKVQHDFDEGDINRTPRHDKVRSSSRGYYEYSPKIKHVHRYEHVYRDYRDRLCHRVVWPEYRFAIRYSCGPRFTFRYVYPYYLRRYIFVSLGGYWPVEYSCVRYYWYGCHPYWWYGYYPIAREVRTDTYNYYTYNYYYDTDGAVVTQSTAANGIQPVDHTTFADVRERLAQQQAEEPDVATLADTYFDEAVQAFEADDYTAAIEKFAQAMELAPDDMILPFAYSQALFANEQYSEAAEILRVALAKVTPEKEGVFYPRGLYPDDEILFEHIDRLREKAEQYGFDADLQLLLGYQLLGIGEIDQALEPLQRAEEDLENSHSAAILLELLIKIKTSEDKPEEDGLVKIPTENNLTTEVQAYIPDKPGKAKVLYLTAAGVLTIGAGIGCYHWC